MSNKTTIVWIQGHQGIPRSEVTDKLTNERTIESQIVGTSFAVDKEVIRSHLRQEYLCRWKACKVFRQSKTLMSEPLASRTKYLQAISRSKLKVAVGLLTGHRTLRDRIFNLGLTQRQDCRLCGDEKEDSVHIMYHCPTLVCKRYKTLGRMFLKPDDLDNMSVSLVANIRLGIVP